MADIIENVEDMERALMIGSMREIPEGYRQNPVLE